MAERHQLRETTFHRAVADFRRQVDARALIHGYQRLQQLRFVLQIGQIARNVAEVVCPRRRLIARRQFAGAFADHVISETQIDRLVPRARAGRGRTRRVNARHRCETRVFGHLQRDQTAERCTERHDRAGRADELLEYAQQFRVVVRRGEQRPSALAITRCGDGVTFADCKSFNGPRLGSGSAPPKSSPC